MANRLITPSQLSLFSRSPVIGAWWEEVHATDPKRAPRPEVKSLDDLLFEAGHKHEKVLIAQLKRENKRVAELRGKQDASDYEECTRPCALVRITSGRPQCITMRCAAPLTCWSGLRSPPPLAIGVTSRLSASSTASSRRFGWCWPATGKLRLQGNCYSIFNLNKLTLLQ